MSHEKEASGSTAVPDTVDSRFAPPLRIPGKPDQTLAPWYYMTITDESRDPTLLGRDWGLTEEPIDTIDKGGFELLGVEYAAVQLIPYTTELQREFDRAIAPWIVDLFRDDPRLACGCAYWSISARSPCENSEVIAAMLAS